MGGRGIFFDAKRLGPDTHVSGFDLRHFAKPHQLANLGALGEGGALAGLVVECGPVGETRWLDWRRFRRPGNVVPFAALAEWFVIGVAGRPIDFRLLVSMLE